MDDQSDVDEADTETRTETDERVDEDVLDEEVVLDLESAQEYEERIETLEERLEDQQSEVERLEDLLLDLSVRAADGRGMGVCPECHGPVVKQRRWVRPTTIECTECGEVYHEY